MFFARLGHCLTVMFKLMRVFFQMMYGQWYVSRLRNPVVTIFGGARMKEGDYYFNQAFMLGQRLIDQGISVLTGGGSGVMQAATCGAAADRKKGARVLGISVKGLDENRNSCAQEYVELDYFFARKWLLTSYSTIFVVFPGGFGTFDELFEVLTLMQTNKLKRVPIVLVGVEFWQPFMHWLESESLEHGLINRADLALFTITDDLNRVFCLVRDECTL